jgi:hypothetical protein
MLLRLHDFYVSEFELVDNNCDHHPRPKSGIKSHFWPCHGEKTFNCIFEGILAPVPQQNVDFKVFGFILVENN